MSPAAALFEPRYTVQYLARGTWRDLEFGTRSNQLGLALEADKTIDRDLEFGTWRY